MGIPASKRHINSHVMAIGKRIVGILIDYIRIIFDFVSQSERIKLFELFFVVMTAKIQNDYVLFIWYLVFFPFVVVVVDFFFELQMNVEKKTAKTKFIYYTYIHSYIINIVEFMCMNMSKRRTYQRKF